jgi:hypothetical protein
MEGIWFIEGTSSTRGPYNGELELRKSNDGTFNAIRVVTYINNFFEGLQVQEVWTGKAVVTPDSVTVEYNLKPADYITRLGELKRDPQELKSTVQVVSRYTSDPKGLISQFSDMKVAQYTEWMTSRRDLEMEPLWKNERKNVDAKGRHIPPPIQGAIKLFKIKIGFDKDPLIKSYKDRAEFENEQPYVVFDPTDFNYYRQNKKVIRVVNKVSDDISVTEAAVKRNAYAPSLDEKAQGYERNTSKYHINQAGMVAYAAYDDQNRFVEFAPNGDSALWTGMYVASQSMRYQVTKEKEALENVRKSLNGLFMLMDITDDPKQFARSIMIYDPLKPLEQGWHVGKAPYQKYIWLEGGNNDMIKGLVHGFLWASFVIPESDTEVWSQLREKSRRMTELAIMNEKLLNRPAAYGLAALLNNDSAMKSEYENVYRNGEVYVGDIGVDTSFYWHGVADWSGINLEVVGAINEITIAQKLNETNLRDRLRERLMDAWVTYSPAQRHLLTMTAYAFAYSAGTRGDHFRDFSSEDKFKEALNQSVWGLREIPYPRPNLDVTIDHSLSSEWCVSPIPRMFWKALQNPKPPMEFFYQGLYNYPVFELQAYDSNFIWKDSAFLYKANRAKGIEYPGVDYLYGYWLAKYAKLNSFN